MAGQEACHIFQEWESRFPGTIIAEYGGPGEGEAPDSQPCLRPVALNFVHYLDIVAFGTNVRSVCPQVLQLFVYPASDGKD